MPAGAYIASGVVAKCATYLRSGPACPAMRPYHLARSNLTRCSTPDRKCAVEMNDERSRIVNPLQVQAAGQSRSGQRGQSVTSHGFTI
eukprot:scaffold240107_cov45-Prasinocladus_malaysianus.AAC.2